VEVINTVIGVSCLLAGIALLASRFIKPKKKYDVVVILPTKEDSDEVISIGFNCPEKLTKLKKIEETLKIYDLVLFPDEIEDDEEKRKKFKDVNEAIDIEKTADQALRLAIKYSKLHRKTYRN
jgi:hypothetical protein